MTFNDSENNAKRYTLRPTFTPLPHSGEKPDGSADHKLEADGTAATSAPLADKPSPAKKRSTKASVIRAANEDDDLYDPYSDYHDGTLKAAEFEEDPWR